MKNTIVVKLKTNKEDRTHLYKVWISHLFRDVTSIDCEGYLDVFCEVGPLNYTIIHHHLDMCKGKLIDIP